MSQTMDKSRIALVTGAGSGIGRAVALALSGAGYSVVLTGRRAGPLGETASRLTNPSLIHPADVSRPQDVATLFDAAVARFGRLDLVFNNAGVAAPPVPLESLTYEQWRGVIDTNLTGVFLCTQAAFRVMKQQSPRGGRIINNGSISADRPRPNSAPYTATKHGVSGLTKAAGLDGRAYDIAVGQIDIGNARTDMMAAASEGMLQADGTVRPEPVIDLKAVTDAVLYMAALPLEANVPFMTVMATKMPLFGRG
jgi:NAD(P)-dependent dehydrogenase (short-subunit alcohol dehydrogenase family)